MFKRIDHIEVVPVDFERSITFYTEVLGFAVKKRAEVPQAAPLQEVAYLDLGDTTLELMRVQEPAPPMEHAWRAGYRMIALEVDDMDAALEYLAEHDVQPTWGPHDMGSTRRAEIRDPDGLPIELRQW